MVAATSPPGGKTLWLMLMQPCGLVLPVSAESCCTAALAAAKGIIKLAKFFDGPLVCAQD